MERAIDLLRGLLSKLPGSWPWFSIYVLGVLAAIRLPAVRDFANGVPPIALLAGLLILLGLLGALTFIVIHQQATIRNKITWYDALGAMWKYRHSTQRYDPTPHCMCCRPQAFPYRDEGRDGQGRPTFSCSSRAPAHDNMFFLHDGSEPRIYLTAAEALSLLPKRL